MNVDLIVDLQYGSTGKGLIAGYLAVKNEYDLIVSANMPNAGHTFIDESGNVMIHKVLPNGIVSPKCKTVLIGPGSVFSIERLSKELMESAAMGYDKFEVIIHGNAVILTDSHVMAESNMGSIGSTKQGSAGAMIEKINRDPGKNPTCARNVSVFSKRLHPSIVGRVQIVSPVAYMGKLLGADHVLAEGAQGFSLGINERFYPYCTSRDCTPARFMADMSIPLPMLKKVIGTARVHPIRVGGTSGGCYPDQEELTWASLGVDEERTTVTNRVRRVFSFSKHQIYDAIIASQPNEVFLNFCNYNDDDASAATVEIIRALDAVGPGKSMLRYLGYGPTVRDVVDITELTFGGKKI